jgi:hypothetical protein
MYGTKLKKFQGCVVLHSANEDGDEGEVDATTLLEDGVDGPKDDSSGSDDDGGQDNCGAASEDSNDEIDREPFGTHAVQLLAIRANYPINVIIAFDWTIGRCIYSVLQGEVQEVCTSYHILYPPYVKIDQIKLISKFFKIYVTEILFC